MENAFHNVNGDGVVGACLTDTGRQDKAENSGARFLIGAHGVEQSLGWNARPGWKRAQATNEGDDSGDVVGMRHTEFVTEEGRGDHSPGNSFPVLVAAIFRNAIESVGESVTEIEDFAKAGLAFVAAYDAGFDLHVAGD